MEDVGARNEKIYVKEYDVFLFRDEADVQEAISDAIRVAAEVTTGRKFLHITVQDEYPRCAFLPSCCRPWQIRAARLRYMAVADGR